MFSNIKAVMKYTPASTMIENYQMAQKEVQEAFNLLIAAKGRLGAAFGTYHDQIFVHDFREYNLERAAERALKIILCYAWKGIISKTQIKKMLAQKRSRQLNEQLEAEALPELDQKTLSDLLNDLFSNVDRYFEEAVKELFEQLRPHRTGYKTNTEFEIGKRVVLCGITDCRGYQVGFGCYGEQKINSLDNVFHMLDGQGISKYPDGAVTQIKAGMRANLWECETDYFELKWYKNGNMHITFKRLDLVEELNRINGGHRIKPQ